MKRKLAVLVLATLPFIAVQALAAPFLQSDPWPAGAAQPDACTATEGATTGPLTLITVNGAKQIKHDLAGATNGVHNITVTCANVWGSSPAVPFAYTKSPPGGASGLHVAP